MAAPRVEAAKWRVEAVAPQSNLSRSGAPSFPGCSDYSALALALAPAPAPAAPAAAAPAAAAPAAAAPAAPAAAASEEAPRGWALHEHSGYYVHDELVIALFAHPGHMRRATGAVSDVVSEEIQAQLACCSDAPGVMEMLPAEDRGLRRLVGALFTLSQFPDRLERIAAGKRQFRKLITALDASQSLLLAGDRVNGIKFREKVSALIPECVQTGDVLFKQERYAEAVEHFLIAAIVYVTSGKRFRVACGQILDQISFCYFMNKKFDKCLLIAEHALYVFVTCGEEVEWALVCVVRTMGKCYRSMHLAEVAMICFHFCLDCARASDYMCVPEKQKRVVDGYKTGALLWVPDTDNIFVAENTMLVAMCMLALDRRDRALELCEKAFDIYVASGDDVRPVHAFVVMTISCYNNRAYEASIKYAHAVCVYAANLRLDKIKAVGLFYGAHATAMCGRHKDAIELFRHIDALPELCEDVRSGIPARLMFADCLRLERHFAEAIEVLEDAMRALPPGAELVCHSIVLASCFAETRDLRGAQKHLELSRALDERVPGPFVLLREHTRERVALLAQELEDRALRASRELCPGFEPGAGGRRARAGRAAAGRAAAGRAPEGRAPDGPPPAAARAGGPAAPADLPAAECCVCLAAEATVAFSPCFHRCICAACAAGVLAHSRECPMCRSASDAAHEILDVAGACARCHAAPRTCAVAPCFHMELCDGCGPHALPARCSTCGVATKDTHRIFG